MATARFPVHRDLAGFAFEVSPVDRKLVTQLASCEFTAASHNVELVGGPGTGKSHLATAIGVAGITEHGKRLRFYSTVVLVNALESEKAEGKAGRIAASLLRLDLVILKLKGDAKLRSLVINVGETLTTWNQSNPTGAGSLTVDDGDDASIREQAPTLGVDPYTRVLKNVDWPKWRRRWVPERDVKPVPQALLIRSEKGAEAEQSEPQLGEMVELSCPQRQVLLVNPETKLRLAQARLTKPAVAAHLERGIRPRRVTRARPGTRSNRVWHCAGGRTLHPGAERTR
jgi:hypothetical protein